LGAFDPPLDEHPALTSTPATSTTMTGTFTAPTLRVKLNLSQPEPLKKC